MGKTFLKGLLFTILINIFLTQRGDDKMEMTKELIDDVFELVEVARATGKIKKGTNETTKAIERGNAEFVAYAGDVSPKEIVMHLPLLSKEKDILCLEVPTKKDLGAACGLELPTASVALTNLGDGKSKLNNIKEKIKELEKVED